MNCFVENGDLGGASLSDVEVYRERSMHGGLGFTKEKLINIFEGLKPVEIRKMREVSEDENTFGKSGLLTARFQKEE